MNKLSILIRPSLAVRITAVWRRVTSCHVISPCFSNVEPGQFVDEWSWPIDDYRTGKTRKYRDGWHCPMNNPKSGDSDLDSTPQGHGKLNILCFWTGHDVGWHDGMPHDGAPPAHGTTSVHYIHYYISLNLISFLKIQFPTINHLISTTSPNRFQNHNVAGALPYVPILGTSGSLANMQPKTKKRSFSFIGL